MNDSEFYFYFRGHIRDTFKTNILKDFVNKLKILFPNIKFIIQTWKNLYCYRNIRYVNKKFDNTIVTEEMIIEYFMDDTICDNCTIIHENKIELIGVCEGTVSNTRCSKIGWKRMWYGKYMGLKNCDISGISDKMVVSVKFDYFDTPFNMQCDDNIFKFINNSLNKPEDNIQTLIPLFKLGTDNFYMGKYSILFKLISIFHKKLDSIEKHTNPTRNQEHIVSNLIYGLNKLFIK